MREAIIAACRRLQGYLKHTHTHTHIYIYSLTHTQREVVYFDFKVLLLSRNKAYLIPVRGGGLRCIMGTKEKPIFKLPKSLRALSADALAGNVVFRAFSCQAL